MFIGDAIHNLRSALDHATWDLLGFDGGVQDSRTAFPCCGGTVAEYEAMCMKINTPSGDTKKFLNSFSAYPGGKGNDIFRLHRLDIIDKHRELVPVVHIASIDNLRVTHPNGRVDRLSCDQFREGPSNTAMMTLGKGERLIIEVDQYTKTTVDMFFDEVDFSQRLPVSKVLLHLSKTVEDCLSKFREFVSQRHSYPSSDILEV